LIITYLTAPAQAEPSLPTVLEDLGFTNVAEIDAVNVTFPPGLYTITLYAEFAGYHKTNELSYYEVGTHVYNLIFAGSEGGFGYLSPPIAKAVTIDCEFGLSMFVAAENHRYFSENSLNPDSPPQNHSKVYENLNDPTMFLIGFENLYGLGDRDYQDMVFSIQMQTPQHVIPEVPFGTIMITACMAIAMAGFVGFKRKHSRTI
jgi:hypothetical protein